MNSISPVHCLNQPGVKEGVKNIAGSITFVFGLLEIHDIYQILRGREISNEVASNPPTWVQVANKVVIACAKISLILSAGVSRPGVFILSSFVGGIFSTVQLNRVFGPHTIFAVNPWHPRHLISIAAVIFALPSVVQSTYKGIDLAYKKVRYYQNNRNVQSGLTDAKIRLMALFNTITSRPILHIGNRILR